MKYYSDVLNKPFSTVEELEKAEKVYNDKLAAEKKKSDEYESDKKEVEEMFDRAYKLRAEFIKKYGSYSYTSHFPFFELFGY